MTDRDFWVFGYGSLIWSPGFDFDESISATLHGWHRAMCILSTHYRGCAKTPGLVLGLDRGGCCRGVAFRVAAARAEAVRAYLDARELVTNVYEPRTVSLRLADGRRVRGYVFTSRRGHEQHIGRLPSENAAAMIRQGVGVSGSSRDYLAATVETLDRLGMRDAALHRLLQLVDQPA